MGMLGKSFAQWQDVRKIKENSKKSKKTRISIFACTRKGDKTSLYKYHTLLITGEHRFITMSLNKLIRSTKFDSESKEISPNGYFSIATVAYPSNLLVLVIGSIKKRFRPIEELNLG
jgi:hypothetical protein